MANPQRKPCTRRAKLPAVRLRPDQCSRGFRITRITPLPSLRATVVEARHERTGARLVHLLTNDTENLFAIAFRTPPPDDTGVPHILEHSVLGGSRKYPVKDPFLEMLKRSMATFINAFTYSDKTVYPVSSNVRQDFFNLVDVYLDAVFHPTISPLTLKQEGHHLEFAVPTDPGGPLIIKGIVYNEMKGAYSELDSLIERVTTQQLFPDTPYGRDSGGDPDAIPSLTYDAFRRFYESLYHPANAFIVIYGDIPTGEHLAFLDRRLRRLPAAAVIRSSIPRQPRWKAPREQQEYYPIGPGESPAGKTAVTVNWLAGDAADPYLDLALEIVDKLLLGHAGTPLYRALIESRLGEDLTPSGYSSGTLETTFHVGLKGTDPEKKTAIMELIFRVLRETAATGFSKDSVDAAFQQLQYAHREISAMYPLRLMNQVYDAWIYDLDPLTGLRLGEFLDELYRRYERDPTLFAQIIRQHLVDNPHRLTVTFLPDAELQARRDAQFAAKMAARKAGLGPADIRRIVEETAELDRRQTAANSLEALATLPALHLKDLPPQPRLIPGETLALRDGVLLLRNDVFANGVNYFVLAFDLNGLPADLWEYLPLFADIFTRVGAEKIPYAVMAERIAANTGGVTGELCVTVDAVDPDRVLPFFAVSFKALDRTAGQALEIVRLLLLELDLNDTARLRDLVLQAKARRQSGIVEAGHRFAAQHAARTLSPLAGLSERLDGLPQVRLTAGLARGFDREIEGLRSRFERIRRFLLNAKRLRASFTGTDTVAETAAAWLDGLAGTLGSERVPATPVRNWPAPAAANRVEGLAIASEVAFCSFCFPAPPATAPEAPAVTVYCKLLALGHLWEEIRIKGGAYGGFSAYDPSAQVLELLSYRDPNIARTLSVFAAIRRQLVKMDLSTNEIERAIISCAKGEERPIRPGPATATALWQHLSGLTADIRNERYQALLRVSGDAVRAAAEPLLAAGLPAGMTCVLAGRSLLEAASAKLPTPLKIEDVLEDAEAAAEEEEESEQ